MCDRLVVPVASLIRLVSLIIRCQEQHAAGDVLDLVGQVLTDERVVEPELVGEDHRLAVFLSVCFQGRPGRCMGIEK